jgi:23S rRNA pseudouridine2457 synthase
MLIALNKPYGTVCQFTSALDKPTLGQWLNIPHVYPAGRLDSDSEGLVLLTDQGWLQAAIAHPAKKLAKRYWVQVEGHADARERAMIEAGIDLGAFRTRPAHARLMAEPAKLWPRVPPIRVRAQIPTSWLEVTLTEGKNRQLRRMTAAIGYPTLRLVRVGIGALDLFALDLAPGQWRQVDEKDLGIAQNDLVPRAKNSASVNTSTGVRSRSHS